ncbi:Class II aaRS and biotin synthetases superfamily protein [Striga hermonthica]|uniref:Histidine--tRNA ligase, cytoplasmic n=1 Tax=Striga hermonthica TaxID=68872 RepID=A0A9N7NPS0_STRHE|nr:Class II aaRS and biotin synthetases superfamily protein [Striga hermonthica]
MAAAGKRVVTLGSKGSSLTPSSVFDVANGFARVTIDSSALSRRSHSSTSSNSAAAKFPFTVPSYFTLEEARASLILLVNKLLLSSSSSPAAAQLLEILERGVGIWEYTLNDVASCDLPQLDFSVAAIDGVSAILDHRSSALASIADALAALSCEALRADVSSFNLMDSGDGSSAKDAVAVAADFKVFFNGSKLVNTGKKLLHLSMAEIPSVHGNFREVSRLLHSKTRVQLNSGFRAGSAKDMSTALSSLAMSLLNLGDISVRRSNLLLAESISDTIIRARLVEMLPAECQSAGTLEELHMSSQAALRKKDYFLFLHSIYELLDVVRKIVSCEGLIAFVALEGSEIFSQTIQGVNGNVDKAMGGECVKADKKSEKKKKVVLGKGSVALVQFIKDRLLGGAAKADLEKCTQDFLVFLDPRGSGFNDLIVKVKEIVESNESRRLPKLPKGTRDFAKEQMAVREKAFSIIVEVFKRHGAMALDTPAFELRETLMGKYGEDSKLIYDLADQGGELCSLRYDLTVPFARYVAMNGLTSFKRYQIAKVYRRDNPSKGRYREFYQCDFDIAGQFEKMGPDFEVIKILTELLDELDIGDYEVKLNHRKLLDGMLAICGVPQEKFRTICSSIDKLDKQTFEQVKKEMVEEKGLAEETADKIGTFVKHRGSPVELLSQLKKEGSEFLTNSDAKLALNELDTLFNALVKAKCVDKVAFDLSLARGLDYYTGVIFEAVFKGATQVGSIAAGGRYDNLIGMFGTKQVPAVGISLGIERVFAIMEQLQKDKDQEIRATETQVLVSILGDDLSLGAELVSELWAAKLKAEFSVNKRVVKHIDRARGARIPYVIIVGDQELSRGIVKLKDVTAANECEVPRGEIVAELRRRVKLPRNYEKALEIIDKHLMFWPKLLVHKTKQRLTKMTQMRIRMRKLALKTREKIMTVPTKEKKREARREEKAEKAAVLEKSIEKELIERLKQGVYNDIYNYPVNEFNSILDQEVGKSAVSEDEEEPEIEYVEGYEDLEEELEDIEDFGGFDLGEDDDNDEMDGADDDDDDEQNVLKKGRKSRGRKLEKEERDPKSRKKVKVHVEVEHEDEPERQTAML